MRCSTCISKQAKPTGNEIKARRLDFQETSRVPKLIQPEADGPFPVTAQSQEELAAVVREWMANHRNTKLLGVNKIFNQLISQGPVEVKLTESPICGLVMYVQIDLQHMLRSLQLETGSCLLVRSVKFNRLGWKGFHAWLGGDLGYSKQVFASTDGLARPGLGEQGNYGGEDHSTSSFEGSDSDFESE